MEVYIIPMNEGTYDNLCYYITRGLQDQAGVFIDVAEPEKAKTFLQKMGVQKAPVAVLTTHKHFDHSDGNTDMKQTFPDIQILGGAEDNVLAATRGLVDGDILEMEGLKIKCHHTPCHTRGHMLFYMEPIEGA